jgi:hypothetical protein
MYEQRSTTREEEEPEVHPDQARRLLTGEALIIAKGRYIRAQIAPARITGQQVAQARAWMASPPRQPQPQQATPSGYGPQSPAPGRQPTPPQIPPQMPPQI